MERKAQSAIEYLIVVGFALTAIAVLTIVYYEHDASSKAQITSSQVDRIAKKIIDSAESVYYMGYPTRTTLKFYMPERITQVTIVNNAVIFKVSSSSGVSDMEYPSSINITGSMTSTQGLKYLKVIAQSGRVCLVEEGSPDCT